MYPKGLRIPGLRPLAGLKEATPPSSVRSSLIAQHDFGPNPGGLRMFLHAPPSLPKGAPLVVVLHGCTQNSAIYDEGAAWSQIASSSGFAILAPEQARENNPNLCFNWFQPGDTARGQGEAASIRQMIEWAITTHGLDRKRIFITGLSAGGAMTSAMLAAYPEVFAGGAIIAGLPAGAAKSVPEALTGMRHAPAHSAAEWSDRVLRASSHTGPWPRISIWQGNADAVVHPSNAEAIIAQWTHLHGVGSMPREDSFKGGHRHRAWHRGDGRVVVEAFNIEGMGHGTPIGNGIGKTGVHFLDANISSTMQIASFWGIAKPEEWKLEKTRPRKNYRDTEPRGITSAIRKALQAAGLL